ncbi:hypothetical protein ACC685_33375 [Rhizobium ruizarguesonis]
MRKPIEIIWGYNKGRATGFDIKVDGKRYGELRKTYTTPEETKLLSDLRATALRAGGFGYVTSQGMFQTNAPITGDEPQRIEKYFARHDFAVTTRGVDPTTKKLIDAEPPIRFDSSADAQTNEKQWQIAIAHQTALNPHL